MSVLATDDMLHVMEWHNGEKEFSPFSDSEMARRQDELRTWMGKNNVYAALFTSYHCINYYSGWRFCYFGRKDRKSVVWGKGVSVRVDLGGGRFIKKKK